MSTDKCDSKFNKTFCALPWLHLETMPTGTTKLCCVAAQPISKDDVPMSLYDHSVEEIWNSDYLRDVRRKMLEGQPVKACSYCYRAEATQGFSIRTRINEEWADEIGDIDALRDATVNNEYRVSDLPIYYQFSLGNLCNLSCRMCNSAYSDKISSDKVHSRWAPSHPGNGVTLSQWQNNSLLIGPMPVVGVQYEGFHDPQFHNNQYFSWTTGDAKVSVSLDEGTQLTSVQIKFLDVAKVGTKFTVAVNNKAAFEGALEAAPWTCEIDTSSLEIGSHLDISIVSESWEYPENSGAFFSLPIEAIHLHRVKSNKQQIGGKPERRFALSRFSKDAPWFEQDSLLFGEFFRNPERIRKLYFTGGEPTLNKSLEAIIDFLNDSGTPEETRIMLNSNATIYNQRLLDKMRRFKAVMFGLSIDSFGDYYEYIRFPAKWETVAANIRKISQIGHPIYVRPNPAIQALNVMNITDLLRFCDELDIPCGINDNIVYAPEHLTIFILPKRAREIAAQRLWEYSNSPESSEMQRMNRAEASQLASFLDHVQQELNFDILKEFMLFTNDLDRSRGQNFRKVHSELFELITESGFKWTRETKYALPKSDFKKNKRAKAKSQRSLKKASASDVTTKLKKANSEIEQLHHRIEAMESSKFWKLRQLWFKLKHVAGMPGE